MSVINILSPHVADMIAAGEVVERPASVIKELIENSFDAGSKNITVEIRGGGATYIRVTDDGCGMTPEDAGIAFLRHATSKLKDENGLNSIATMGFRGEALAAISAVSKVELTTRRAGSQTGTRVTLEAGDIQDMMTCGCPEGTTMLIRDIFFNTPARLKFLKSDRSEAAACQAAALRCALAHPEVSVRFMRDGREEFFSPGDGNEAACIYSLLGRELASSLLAFSGESTGIKARGFISAPAAARGNRSQQYFFCNGRFIKSQLLQAAVEQAYKNTLLSGRFPACVVYIELPFGLVDVNVHPAKTEVKFSSEKAVYDAVYYSVLAAIEESRTPVQVNLGAVSAKPEAKPDFYRSMTAAEFRSSSYSVSGSSGSTSAKALSPESRIPAVVSGQPEVKPASQVSGGISPSGAAQKLPSSRTFESSKSLYEPFRPQEYNEQLVLPLSSDTAAGTKPTAPDHTPTQDTVPDADNVENTVQNVENCPPEPCKFIGEALNTYIIAERSGEMILIDKHAAHERMIFDRLRKSNAEISSQTLLTPVTVTPSSADADMLESNMRLLSELGFEIEPFGITDYVVRSIPSDMDIGQTASAIEEICEKLRSGKTLSPSDVRDEILHTVACKAAIKAGWNTHPDELIRIVEAVSSGEVRYCPHGRPVAVTLTRHELDKLFKRIV